MQRRAGEDEVWRPRVIRCRLFGHRSVSVSITGPDVIAPPGEDGRGAYGYKVFHWRCSRCGTEWMSTERVIV